MAASLRDVAGLFSQNRLRRVKESCAQAAGHGEGRQLDAPAHTRYFWNPYNV
jgi:hypothetical protein